MGDGDLSDLSAQVILEELRRMSAERDALKLRAEVAEALVAWWRQRITFLAAHLRRHDPRSPAGPGSRYSCEWLETLLADPSGGTPSPQDHSTTPLDAVGTKGSP